MNQEPTLHTQQPGEIIDTILTSGPDFTHIIRSTFSMKPLEQEDKVSDSPVAMQVVEAIASYYKEDDLMCVQQRLAAIRAMDAAYKMVRATGVVRQPRYAFSIDEEGRVQDAESSIAEASKMYPRNPGTFAATRLVREYLDPDHRTQNSTTFSFAAGLLLIENGLREDMTAEASASEQERRDGVSSALIRMFKSPKPDSGHWL
jgi:hypothetical protein